MIIAMEGKVALEPGGDGTAKIRSQDGKGSLTFDAESGRLSVAAVPRKPRWSWSKPGKNATRPPRPTRS